MQLLNNRLVQYIEAVRSRDIEISSLKTERSTVEETHTQEVRNEIQLFPSIELTVIIRGKLKFCTV